MTNLRDRLESGQPDREATAAERRLAEIPECDAPASFSLNGPLEKVAAYLNAGAEAVAIVRALAMLTREDLRSEAGFCCLCCGRMPAYDGIDEHENCLYVRAVEWRIANPEEKP